MTLGLIEALLHQSESETLDFKRDQYLFENKATNEEKSALLKDILAFINSWRQSEAYILVGVEEVRGGRSIPYGVTRHLSNQNLQQFVHGKTNREVAFSYSQMEVEGKSLGVLSIPLQERPVYLLKDFGKLQANTVYIRRGDTTGQASPDEVIRMQSHRSVEREQPILDFGFGLLTNRRKFGTSIRFRSRSCKFPAHHKLPLYGSVVRSRLGMVDASDMTLNREYYREMAAYIEATSYLQTIGFAVTNSSTTVAQNVLVTVELGGAQIVVYAPNQLPARPTTDRFSKIMSNFAKRDSTFQVEKFGDTYEVRAKIESVQPGRTEWSSTSFSIGARKDTSFEAIVKISADNLRVPLIQSVAFRLETSITELSLEQLKELCD